MADISEQKIYEVMGLPIPEAGAQEQDPANPAAQTSEVETDEGAQVQDLADPADVDTDPSQNDSPEQGEAEEQGNQPLTPEQRRANAARRRQQEEQIRIDQAVRTAVEAEQEKAAANLKDIFTRAGLKNTITGQPISTMDEFNSWYQQFTAGRLQQEMKSGKMTPEVLNQAISAHPVVKKAEEVIRQSEAAQKQQEESSARAKIDAQIAEIHKLDPSINTVQDLLNMPNAKAFYAYAKKGYELKDAYYLANREQLQTAAADAAKQQALNNARGKEHLRATGNARGSGAVAVPKEDMAMFRHFNPNATEAEIQAFYNKFHNH